MTLTELNEKYDEYTNTEEYYLEEGLKIFKKSKRLYNFADRIDKKIAKMEKKSKVSPAEMSKIKKISSDLVKLADEYKVIEDDFSKGKTDKKLSKEKIKRVNRDNERLLVSMKNNEAKQAFKKIGLGALVVAAAAVLAQLGVNFNVGGKIAGFFTTKKVTPLPIRTMGPNHPMQVK